MINLSLFEKGLVCGTSLSMCNHACQDKRNQQKAVGLNSFKNLIKITQSLKKNCTCKSKIGKKYPIQL